MAGYVAVHTAGEAFGNARWSGYMGEYDISRLYRDAKIIGTWERTREIGKELVAGNLLKKQF
jgi:alkylation response protein AidB-like acyl-CoA dehydrogenase